MRQQIKNCLHKTFSCIVYRPFQMVGYLIGLIAVIIALLFAGENRVDINQIKSSFCSPEIHNRTPDHIRQCRDLLDNLLKNPSPQEAQRLREIIKDGH